MKISAAVRNAMKAETAISRHSFGAKPLKILMNHRCIAVCTSGNIVLACLRTAAVFGVDACPVHVEVDVSYGFPNFVMVGLPDASVRESRDRVRSAIRNSGFEFPPRSEERRVGKEG